MKKAGYALIILTVMLCIFAVGFLVGRNFNHSSITMQKPSQKTETTTTTTKTVSGKININKASADELTVLPGIGTTLAQRIVNYRNKNGAFRNASDLLNVEGIGQQKLLQLLDYITI